MQKNRGYATLANNFKEYVYMQTIIDNLRSRVKSMCTYKKSLTIYTRVKSMCTRKKSLTIYTRVKSMCTCKKIIDALHSSKEYVYM